MKYKAIVEINYQVYARKMICMDPQFIQEYDNEETAEAMKNLTEALGLFENVYIGKHIVSIEYLEKIEESAE